MVPHNLEDNLDFMDAAESGYPVSGMRQVHLFPGPLPRGLLAYSRPLVQNRTLNFSFPVLLPKHILAFAPSTSEEKVSQWRNSMSAPNALCRQKGHLLTFLLGVCLCPWHSETKIQLTPPPGLKQRSAGHSG